MSSYATVPEFEAYVEGWVTDDEAALERLLERATRDVDDVIGPLYPRRVNPFRGLKLDPASDLDDAGREALSRATCAQALHRFLFLEPAQAAAAANPAGAVKAIKGPDFEVTYADGASPVTGAGGHYSPRLRDELAPLSYLRRRGARATA